MQKEYAAGRNNLDAKLTCLDLETECTIVMKQYKSIDAAKFLCAVLIIILHTAPFSSYSKALTFGLRNVVTVIAVPFFFAVSGFLTFQKLSSLRGAEQKVYIRRYLKRLAVMYGIWSAVYFPFVVIQWIRSGFTWYRVLEYIKDFFFEGSYSTIWFLPALFTATLAVFLLRQVFRPGTVLAISCGVYLFTLMGSSYYGLAMKIPLLKAILNGYYSFFDTIKNGICFGMVYVALGAFIADREARLPQQGFVRRLITVVILAVILAAEEFLVAWFDWNSRGVDTVVSLVPFTYCFICLLLETPVNLPLTLCGAMRKYSILMFLCQRIPLSVIGLFLADSVIARNSMLHFLSVLTGTMLICFCILRGAEKYKFLKYAF